jgi:hypothetical protein
MPLFSTKMAFGAGLLLALLLGCPCSAEASSWFGFGRFGANNNCEEPCVPGGEDLMRPKAHGTSETPVQDPLRWGCDANMADRICNYNRHYAEWSGYWETTRFLSEIDTARDDKPVTFFDSNTGKPLFTAPVGRTWTDFLLESRKHGWPSFRDQEVNWDNVRVLPNGITVSVDGTHLGHQLPDSKGRRYCINLVSVAGNPVASAWRRLFRR